MKRNDFYSCLSSVREQFLALLPFALRVLQRAMGKACAQKLAIRVHNDLEAHLGFQEELLHLLFAGITCKRVLAEVLHYA